MKRGPMSLRAFARRRRGDLLGAIAAGSFFVYVSPNTEAPQHFAVFGAAMAIAGALAIIVLRPFDKSEV